MKKLLALICVLVLVVSFAACGNKSEKEDGVVTLTWYVPLSAQADMGIVMEEAAKITEPLIGARLDIQTIDVSAFGERMNMNMAAGNDYDLTFTGYVNPYLQAVSRGGLMDITDLIDKEATALKESIPEYAWEAARVDGRIYAVPNLQGFAPPNSLQIRKDLAEKYNFDVDSITKMEDLEPFLKAVKEGESGMFGIRPSYGTEMWTGGVWEPLEAGVAIRADGSSPEVCYIYDTPEYQKGLDTLMDWYKKGYIRKDLISVGDDSQDVRSGKYAIQQSGWLPGAEQSAKISNGGHDVIMKQMMKPYLNKTKALATMVAIGANCKHPEKAIKMIELINTNKDLYNLISYGIEGKHYDLNEEGKVVINQASGYKHNSAWMFGNQFNALVMEGQDDDVWEQTEKMNNESVTSPLLGFVLDTDPIKNEIAQISAVNAEYTLFGFIVNGKDNWDAYMKKLDQAGRKKVLDEIQKQVNEYWEKNNK